MTLLRAVYNGSILKSRKSLKSSNKNDCRILLQQGGFIWLFYIPRGSFKDLVNQCSRIEASVVTDCPGLVQKCGFHLLYKHDEVEFQETIRQCMALFSNEHEVRPKKSSCSSEDPQSDPVDPTIHKDKGKGVLEY